MKTFKKTYNSEKQCSCDESEQDFAWPENSNLQTALSEKSSKCEDCRKISQPSEKNSHYINEECYECGGCAKYC